METGLKTNRERPVKKQRVDLLIRRFSLATGVLAPALICVIYLLLGANHALFLCLFLVIGGVYIFGWVNVLSKKECSLTIRAFYFLTGLTVNAPVFLAFEPSLDIRLNGYLDLAIEHPVTTLGAGIMPALPFIWLAIWAKGSCGVDRMSSFSQFGQKLTRYSLLLLFLCLLTLALTTFVLAFLPMQNIFYFVGRVLTSIIYFAPFFLGLLAYRYRSVYLVFIPILLLLLTYSTLTGNRGIGFNSTAAFLIGDVLARISSKKFSANLFYILNVVLIISLLVGFAVKSGEARNFGGRITVADLVGGETIFTKASRAVNPNEFDTGMTTITEAASRITRWPYYVIPWLAPKTVPLLGYDDLGLELSSALRLPYTALDNLEYDNRRYLQRFGLAVHYDEFGNRSSSVPLPLFVDGYLRFGWVGGFLYVLVFLFIVKKLELFLRRKLHNDPSSVLIVLLWLFSATLSSSQINGFLIAIRWLILSGLIVFPGLWAFRALRFKYSLTAIKNR